MSNCVNGKTKGDCYNNATRQLLATVAYFEMVCCNARACSRRPTTIWWLLAKLVMARPVTVVFGLDTHAEVV